MIVRKNMAELEKMRAAGLLVWKVLDTLRKMVAEGVTTYELEVAADKMIADAGARPAFKGYSTPSAGTKFPFVLCTSVNDEIVHGMPSARTTVVVRGRPNPLQAAGKDAGLKLMEIKRLRAKGHRITLLDEARFWRLAGKR